MAKTEGYLYALRAEGHPYIKIGSTIGSPQKRLRTLQTGQPYRLLLCASAHVEEDVRRVEKAVHSFLREKRQHGEWFALESMDDAQLVSLITEAMQYLDAMALRRPSHGRIHGGERLPIFEERLFVTRRRRQLSQEQLAEKTGLFKTDISKYERGTSMPTVARLMRLADALDVSTDFLLGRQPSA